MERLKGFGLTGACLALGLAALPAAAQDQTATKTTQTTTTVTQNRINSMQNDMAWDHTLPASPARDRMMLLQLMSDKSFGKADILKVLPLLEDLRDAENIYAYGMEDTANNWAMTADQTRFNGMEEGRTSSRAFTGKRDAIWNAITTAVGADKAGVLRPLVEPVRQDVSSYSYTSSHLQRVDQLLRDWDRLAAERVAANPGTATNTASTVSVETTTTTTTTTMPGLEFYTFPTLTTQDLVDVMEMRLASLEGAWSPEAVIAVRGHELTSPTLRFLREKSLKSWD